MRFDGGPRGHHRNALSGIGTHLKAWQCGIRRHRARARAEPTGRGWAAAVTFAEVARARYRREYEADAHRARPDPLGAGLPGRHQPADALEDRECSDVGAHRDGGWAGPGTVGLGPLILPRRRPRDAIRLLEVRSGP